MLNPLHLRTLTWVLRTGSFALAARQLGTRPPLSPSRSPRWSGRSASRCSSGRPGASAPRRLRRSSPPAGRRCWAHWEPWRRTSGAWRRGRAATVRLGSFPTASEHLVPAALASLAVSHPSVEVLLEEGEPVELAPAIHDGDLDVALVYRYTRVSVRYPYGLTVGPLLREDLVLLLPVGHPSAGSESVTLEDLEHAIWVTTREGTEGRPACGACAPTRTSCQG